MITVKTKLLSKPSSSAKLSESLIVAAANSVSETYADIIKKNTQGKACAVHKPGRGTIMVVADKKKQFIVQKSGFCCKDFENSIVITTK